MKRKQFIRNATLASLALTYRPTGLGAFYPDNLNVSLPIIPYENNLRDHLWMWGHASGYYDGPNNVYNIPLSPPISMVDAIKSMGIPNLCVIRPDIPDAVFVNQLKIVKRITWALAMGSNKSYHALKDYVFWLQDFLPNMVGYYLDDFFHMKKGFMLDRNTFKEPAPAALSIAELKQLRAELNTGKSPLDLCVTLYSHQLNTSIVPAIKYIDVVGLWTWDGSNLQNIEEDFKKYRSLVPNKRTLMGIYMWNFGERKEIDQSLMIKQLEFAYRLYKEGQIDGMIFHSTILVNKHLKAVDYARDWIAKHGNESR